MDDKPIPVLDESDSTAKIDNGYRVGQAELSGACVRLPAQVEARLNTSTSSSGRPQSRLPNATLALLIVNLPDKLLGLHFIERASRAATNRHLPDTA
jgi:hypothetical protein